MATLVHCFRPCPAAACRVAGPRSSGDRAPPSGGGSASSNLAGGANQNIAPTRANAHVDRSRAKGSSGARPHRGRKNPESGSFQSPNPSQLAGKLGEQRAVPVVYGVHTRTGFTEPSAQVPFSTRSPPPDSCARAQPLRGFQLDLHDVFCDCSQYAFVPPTAKDCRTEDARRLTRWFSP